MASSRFLNRLLNIRTIRYNATISDSTAATAVPKIRLLDERMSAFSASTLFSMILSFC